MTELWSQFFDLLANNVYFRSGFLFALFLGMLGWLLMRVLNVLYVRWIKIRQFFEPTQQPGKVPMEKGPSPARNLLGCLGNLIVLLLVIALVVVALFGITGSSGG